MDDPDGHFGERVAAHYDESTPEMFEAAAIDPVVDLLAELAYGGRALAALGDGDAAAYAAALEEIVADFAARDRHLSGVPVADTAMVLERLAEPLGMAARPPTPLIPPSIYCDRTGL